HNFLEDLGVFGHGLGAKLVQKEVTGANALVVATEAVELNGGPLRFGLLRDLVRGLGEDLGVGRNDTDGTRNADKPSSEFHISHHLARFIPAHGFIVDCDTGKQGSKRDTLIWPHCKEVAASARRCGEHSVTASTSCAGRRPEARRDSDMHVSSNKGCVV